LLQKRQGIPTEHDLRKLAEKTAIVFTKDEQHTLDHFREIIVWRGRYPTPKTEKQWDNYQDHVAGNTQTRSTSGTKAASKKVAQHRRTPV
jgi:hypothetical protein